MNVHAVIGAGWGDEGKGTIVAQLASKNPLETIVILTNGGAQRGHSVLFNGKTYNNKHFGSGSCFGSASFFGPEFILDPMQFTQEYNLSWVKNPPTIYRHKECMWVTPFDIIINQNDALRFNRHNTCGMGIWMTKQRFLNTRFNWSFDSFMQNDYEHKFEYLNNIAEWYREKYSLKDTTILVPEYIPFFEDLPLRKGLIDHFIKDCEFLYNSTTAVDNWDMVKYFKTVIFENGQGLAIGDTGDNDKEKTPSYTGLKAIPRSFVASLIQFIEHFTIHYVSRTYETRHGDDNNFGHVNKKIISSYIEEDTNNHYNQWQGEFKYNTLNTMLLSQRILKDLLDLNPIIRDKNITTTILELTHCDEVGGENIVCNIVDKIRFTGDAEVTNDQSL